MALDHSRRKTDGQNGCVEHSGLATNIKITNSLLATLLTVNLSLAAYLTINLSDIKVSLSAQSGRIANTEQQIKDIKTAMQ